MACKPVCRLCDHLVISQVVTFTGGNLVINLPAGAYNNLVLLSNARSAYKAMYTDDGKEYGEEHKTAYTTP